MEPAAADQVDQPRSRTNGPRRSRPRPIAGPRDEARQFSVLSRCAGLPPWDAVPGEPTAGRSRRTLAVRIGVPVAMVVIGIVLEVAFGGVAGIVGAGLIGVAFVIGLANLFYEIGRSEDRERAREQAARTPKGPEVSNGRAHADVAERAARPSPRASGPGGVGAGLASKRLAGASGCADETWLGTPRCGVPRCLGRMRPQGIAAARTLA